MRYETKAPPSSAGNVQEIAIPAHEGVISCLCGKPAVKRLRNAYRFADVCNSVRCYRKAFAWVGNFPHTADDQVGNKTVVPSSRKPLRKLNIGTGARS